MGAEGPGIDELERSEAAQVEKRHSCGAGKLLSTIPELEAYLAGERETRCLCLSLEVVLHLARYYASRKLNVNPRRPEAR
jgi:hypothetical protein